MAANLQFKSTPLRERVSKEEWDVRVDLAAAYQLAAIFKWTDLIYTHFSARVPGTEDFLINPYGLMFDEITASSLVRIDADGKIIDDPLDMGVNEAGFVIHSCMHRARRRTRTGRRCCACSSGAASNTPNKSETGAQFRSAELRTCPRFNEAHYGFERLLRLIAKRRVAAVLQLQ